MASWLGTERLQLRAWRAEDLDDFAALTADAAVMRWVGDGSVLDRARTAVWIERANQNIARWGFGTHAVVERAGGRPIGWAGLIRSEDTPGEDEAEIIYALAPDRWGRGYATELVRGMLDWAWRESELARVLATVDPANAASIALLLRLGFVLCGEGVDRDGLAELRYEARRP
ncbi:GNAT family N-acetyltransferase [Chitinimonas koreensis]|uniref:GNAT family N-acetyltransferase n=1 Tax=Chitinimonas koreensis TaxID=356302 RepID=UPI000427FAD5|nr:GNAT family N-acetyltransferase [Chitinimonas koreensis]QNM96073.1 GNAT family N-acetyltransferase [Chitinimonas koreensis]